MLTLALATCAAIGTVPTTARAIHVPAQHVTRLSRNGVDASKYVKCRSTALILRLLLRKESMTRVGMSTKQQFHSASYIEIHTQPPRLVSKLELQTWQSEPVFRGAEHPLLLARYQRFAHAHIASRMLRTLSVSYDRFPRTAFRPTALRLCRAERSCRRRGSCSRRRGGPTTTPPAARARRGGVRGGGWGERWVEWADS
eukprot:3837963-Pleurochrysis_carterae.AAC.1